MKTLVIRNEYFQICVRFLHGKTRKRDCLGRNLSWQLLILLYNHGLRDGYAGHIHWPLLHLDLEHILLGVMSLWFQIFKINMDSIRGRKRGVLVCLSTNQLNWSQILTRGWCISSQQFYTFPVSSPKLSLAGLFYTREMKIAANIFNM